MTKKLVKFSEEEMRSDPSNAIISAKELDQKIKEVNSKTTDMMIAASPDLARLSWEMYEKYKTGELQTYFDDDKELEAYYNIKKKETIVNMITFVSLASSAIVNSNKIDASSIKELSGALVNAVALIQNMMGEPNRVIEHKHEVSIKDPVAIQEKLRENKEKLDALDAEFEFVDDGDEVEI